MKIHISKISSLSTYKPESVPKSGYSVDESLSISTKDKVDINNTVSSSVEAKQAEKSKFLTELFEVCHIQKDILGPFKITGAALGGSAALSLVGGVGALVLGFRELKAGKQEGDKLKMFEGATEMLAGGGSSCDFLTGALSLANVTTPLAGVIAGAGTVFGLSHGVGDTVIGIAKTIEGIKDKDKEEIISGALSTGIGLTVSLLAVGIGGVPAASILAGLFVTKLICENKESLKKLFNKAKSHFK